MASDKSDVSDESDGWRGETGGWRPDVSGRQGEIGKAKAHRVTAAGCGLVDVMLIVAP